MKYDFQTVYNMFDYCSRMTASLEFYVVLEDNQEKEFYKTQYKQFHWLARLFERVLKEMAEEEVM